MKQAFRETIGSRGILLLVVLRRIYLWHLEIAKHLHSQHSISARRQIPHSPKLVELQLYLKMFM